MPNADASRTAAIERVEAVIGLEIHVELRCATKVFSPARNPAHSARGDDPANTLVDPVVLALPGALPRLNRAAADLAVRVGLTLGCAIAPAPKWDRKSYVYPDLPKGYQISQLDRPLCGEGAVTLPAIGDDGEPDWTAEGRRIRIERAHLEEDAGKLLHEAPGGGPLDGSIIDFNRAGAPLLEIVTAPDFRSAAEAVVFCRLLRWACRAAGATHGVLERGHMRFEPNINCELTLGDGRWVRTPIVEVKNLNSFRAVQGAIEHELREQPERWRRDGVVFGPGAKRTHGWDDAAGVTVPQRAKEDADDYRYFPDPDLPVIHIDSAAVDAARTAAPPFPTGRIRSLIQDFGLTADEALTLIEHPGDVELFERSVSSLVGASGAADRGEASRTVANLLLQHGARLAKTASTDQSIAGLGLTPAVVGAMAALRISGELSASNAGLMIERIAAEPASVSDAAGVRALTAAEGWLTVRDDGQLHAWCDAALEEHAAIADQVREGKTQAIGRLIGAVMKTSGGKADAKAARAYLLERIGVEG